MYYYVTMEYKIMDILFLNWCTDLLQIMDVPWVEPYQVC